MPKFHVHVYDVLNLAELNVEAADGKSAMEQALSLVKTNLRRGEEYHSRSGNWKESDCRFIAIPFQTGK